MCARMCKSMHACIFTSNSTFRQHNVTRAQRKGDNDCGKQAGFVSVMTHACLIMEHTSLSNTLLLSHYTVRVCIDHYI